MAALEAITDGLLERFVVVEGVRVIRYPVLIVLLVSASYWKLIPVEVQHQAAIAEDFVDEGSHVCTRHSGNLLDGQVTLIEMVVVHLHQVPEEARLLSQTLRLRLQLRDLRS